MNTSYAISSTFWLVKDSEEESADLERLLFHVKAGDYFSTLATILGFVEETMKEQDSKKKMTYEINTLRHMKKDLVYLNDNFDIKPKKVVEKTKSINKYFLE